MHVLSKDLQATVTSIPLTGLQLKPGIHYYTVVQAYNSAGLHTTETSDGFMLDLEPPIPGVVLDGKGIVLRTTDALSREVPQYSKLVSLCSEKGLLLQERICSP